MGLVNTLEIRVFQISISFLVGTWIMVRTQHLSILVTIATELTEKTLFLYQKWLLLTCVLFNTLEISVFEISTSFLVGTRVMMRTQHQSILVTIATELTEKSLFTIKKWLLPYVPCEHCRLILPWR